MNEATNVRRIFIQIQYDGAALEGWQIQASGATVQAALESAIRKALGEETRIHGAGRTDSGVHALAMTAHFDTKNPMPAAQMAKALTAHLPDEIVVTLSREVGADFDARRDAVMRWYRYQIDRSPHRRPLGPRAWRLTGRLDTEAMRQALEILAGEHDFGGLRSSGCTATRTELTLSEASMIENGELLALDFKCRSFLQRMVRLMVGAVAMVGQGKLTLDQLREILASGQRPSGIVAAPAAGLCLMRVGYTEAETENILTDHRLPPSF